MKFVKACKSALICVYKIFGDIKCDMLYLCYFRSSKYGIFHQECIFLLFSTICIN